MIVEMLKVIMCTIIPVVLVLIPVLCGMFYEENKNVFRLILMIEVGMISFVLSMVFYGG